MSLKLLTVFLFVSRGFGFSCNTQFQVSDACHEDYGTPRNVTGNVATVAMCLSLCCEDDKCASVLFDGLKKSCTTNSGFAKNLTTGCGLKYAAFVQSNCKVVSILGNVCDTDDDCNMVDNKISCVAGQCSCKAGYSFNPANSSCIEFCDLYGTTFTAFEGFLLAGNNDIILPNMDKASCQAECINASNFTCRTAELAIDNNCFLSTETASTKPSKYIPHADYTYYQRNCEILQKS